MRLATTRDELEPLRDPSISGPDDPHLTILVLSRVIVSLGSMTTVSTDVIENLYASDLAYLQEFHTAIDQFRPWREGRDAHGTSRLTLTEARGHSWS